MPESQIGVLLYLPPMLRDHPLQAHGLARHALTTTAALVQARPCTVVVVTPRWVRAEVAEVLGSLTPEHRNRIAVRSPWFPAPSELLARAAVRWRSRSAKSTRARRSLPPPLRGTTAWALSSWVGMLVALSATALALMAAVALVSALDAWIPVLLAASLAGLGVLAWATGVLGRVIHRWRIRTRVQRAGQRIWTRLGLSRAWITLVEPADVAALVRTANRSGVRTWWIPASLYADVAKLKGRRIATFADFAPAEFPRMLIEQPALEVRGQAMRACLSSSDAIICLSEHVRSRHLPSLVPDSRALVEVIPPGPPVRPASAMPSGDRWVDREALLDSLGRRFPRSVAVSPGWWSEPVLIAPTQSRPYKNLRTLVTAMRIVNVHHRIRARLILTADPKDNDLGEFVARSGSRAYVEFMPRMSDRDLNLALASSDLAVTPSVFEGSLPYTLYESVSVGTPCLMADIPVTREATARFADFQEASLFDPHSSFAIAEAIRRTLPATEGLLAVQEPVVKEYYRAAGWDVVAQRYWSIVDQVTTRV